MELSKGIKHDADKPRVSEVLGPFSRALMEVARVGTRGLNKYPDADNWLRVPQGRIRYTNAMLRHYLSEGAGANNLDRDSGMLHAAHVAWNALARLELILRECAEIKKVAAPGSVGVSSWTGPLTGGPFSADNSTKASGKKGLKDASPAEWDRAVKDWSRQSGC